MSDYALETLGPERFQQLCQAVLINEFPDLQCLPVAQPDGGRDAVSHVNEENTHDLLVFQVKFGRRPETIKDPVVWLEEAIDKELPKIRNLAKRGAKKYILLTNLMGSAHLDHGTIDRTQEMLEAKLPIPAQCWWRDDIARRLENHSSIRWAYVEIIRGGDLLQQLLETDLSEERRRRTSALRAYVQSQHHDDRTVRFRQIDLRNQLLDLFIDVPAALKFSEPETKETARDAQLVLKIAEQIQPERVHAPRYFRSQTTLPGLEPKEERTVRPIPRVGVGAAALFLHSLAQEKLSTAVLEGAPGQGKSTLAQYMCQVHRIRLLGLAEELRHIPKPLREAPLRVPIRIELRDLAAAIQDRQLPDGTTTHHPAGRISLEEFIAAHVRKHSGGVEFSVADLHFVASEGPLLLVLDGLDEVADIDLRREIIAEVTSAVQRLRAIAPSLQVLVTSRPAAFANSPGFSEENFRYFSLKSITRELISDYALRWSQAKGLTDEERVHVTGVLETKLHQPHMRELARNPMQLAILLSLINTLGSSLPDKRTALYDEYIKLFINREVEKDRTVLRYRELLIDIHRYLAWLLHSNAEKGNSRGSIPREQLMETLRTYLSDERRDPRLVDELFQGVTERVMALVQRVEGAYEFEVQPLREYFCAKYLYETAPYSPVGRQRRGTKPDRFDAIARNLYWLNVTRFYAGCYTKGELADLADRLEELWTEPDFSETSYPRLLTTMLLQDWVFEQSPRTTGRVINLVTQGLGFRHTLRSESAPNEPGETVILPEECGRGQLLHRSLELLDLGFPTDRVAELSGIACANSNEDELREQWYDYVMSKESSARTEWLEYGSWLGVLSDAPIEYIEAAMSDGIDQDKRMVTLILNGASAFCEVSPERTQQAVKAILATDMLPAGPPAHLHSRLEKLAAYLGSLSFTPWYYAPFSGMSLEDAMRHSVWGGMNAPKEVATRSGSDQNAELKVCEEALAVLDREFKRPATEWAESLDPWDQVVSTVSERWGENWFCFLAACLAAGISSKSELATKASTLDAPDVSLVQRARYARLRAGSHKWWAATLEQPMSEICRDFSLALLLGWGSLKTIGKLEGHIAAALRDVPEWNLARIDGAITSIGRTRSSDRRLVALSDNAETKLPLLLAARVGEVARSELYERHIASVSVKNALMLRLQDRVEMPERISDVSVAEGSLAIVRRAYRRGDTWPAMMFERRATKAVMKATAGEILRDPIAYPLTLVRAVEAARQGSLARRIRPVVDVAIKGGWFE